MNKLIFIAIFSMAFADGYSQTYNHSQLIGTKWITTWGLRRISGSTKTNLGFSKYVGTLEFTNSEMKESYYKEYSYIRPPKEHNLRPNKYKTSLADYNRPYYLSPSVPTTFDSLKVGDSRCSGNYVVYKNKFNKTEHMQIVTLNDSVLILGSYHYRRIK